MTVADKVIFRGRSFSKNFVFESEKVFILFAYHVYLTEAKTSDLVPS